jgi:hypothetical protein
MGPPPKKTELSCIERDRMISFVPFFFTSPPKCRVKLASRGQSGHFPCKKKESKKEEESLQNLTHGGT